MRSDGAHTIHLHEERSSSSTVVVVIVVIYLVVRSDGAHTIHLHEELGLDTPRRLVLVGASPKARNT